MSGRPETDPPVLSIRDLTVSFAQGGGDRLVAVDGLSLDLHPGCVTALVGESGSGKSVAAMSTLGLVPTPPARIDRGSVVYRDAEGRERNLLAVPARTLRSVRGGEIAMIFQEPMTSLNPVMRIGAQIVEAVRLHRSVTRRAAQRIARELLERVGIRDAGARLGHYPHEFSGGMRQRVMIAIALACGPRVLIADEPTTALDVTIQASILELIRGLADEEGLSVLMITHDLALVRTHADRIAVMYRGHLLETGSCDAVHGNPAHPYTRGLLATVPDLGDRRERLATIAGVLETAGGRPVRAGGVVRTPWTPGAGDGSAACARTEMVDLGGGHSVRVAAKTEPRAGVVG